MEFMPKAGRRREGPVSWPTYEQPGAEVVEQVNAAWSAWRRSRYGPAAEKQPARRYGVPRAVAELLDQDDE